MIAAFTPISKLITSAMVTNTFRQKIQKFYTRLNITRDNTKKYHKVMTLEISVCYPYSTNQKLKLRKLKNQQEPQQNTN